MRKKVTGLLLGALIIGRGIDASAALINAGFESGDFTGWTTPYAGEVVTSWTGDDPATPYTYTPMEGSYFARLEAGAGIDVYTTISQTVSFAAGESVGGYAAFDYRDYGNYDDSARVQILDTNGSVVATPWYEDGSTHPDNWDGPWTSWSWTALTAGDYTIEYGVANEGDNEVPSVALFDFAPVPEPVSVMLLGVGGLLFGVRRNRQKAVA